MGELNLPVQTPLALPDLPSLSGCLRVLVRKRRAGGRYQAEAEDALLRGLLYGLSDQIQEQSDRRWERPYFRALQELRTEIYNTPEKHWQVPAMASQLHLSVSYFQHLYREVFGISCIRDVIEARMERAKFLLETTDLAVWMLAEVCGYESELHFMRQFRQREGRERG